MLFPYNDETMIYDYKRHKYCLTVKGVFLELGENLDTYFPKGSDCNQSTMAKRLLQRISRKVYNYIYQDSMNTRWLEYELAKQPFLRERIKNMLVYQLEYFLVNGDSALSCGVNIDKGSTIDIQQLRGRVKIADDTEILANEVIPELGRSLKYLGIFGEQTPTYEEGNY